MRTRKDRYKYFYRSFYLDDENKKRFNSVVIKIERFGQ